MHLRSGKLDASIATPRGGLMQLYGVLGSPYVARVVLYARLKGFDLVAAQPEGGIKSPAFLARNPIGKVPVLEIDGVCTPESAVICALLEDLYPGKPGLEGTPLERARARTIERIFDLYVSPQAAVLFRNLDPSTRDAAAVRSAQDEFARSIAFIEHYMAAPYAAGRAVTVADCALLPAFAIYRKTFMPMVGVPDPTTGTGKLKAWWHAMLDHAITGPFIPEYDTAVDALLASFAQR
jgi:glutathione S-transferase